MIDELLEPDDYEEPELNCECCCKTFDGSDHTRFYKVEGCIFCDNCIRPIAIEELDETSEDFDEELSDWLLEHEIDFYEACEELKDW